ncbi:MAG: hypothetical protein GXN98_04080 [Euryarchaeota archaeon]|nr:hypothetical protein [Euryarchaeota archaeon]
MDKRKEIPEVERFKAKYGGNFTIVGWDERNRRISSIYGWYYTGRGIIDTEAKAEALAREFLEENLEFFKINLAGLRLRKAELDMRGVWIVDYDQYYRGIPVYGGWVRVILNNRSVITDVINNFYPDINISTTPKLSREEAVEVVASITGESSLRSDIVSLFILPVEAREYRLAWRVWSAKELAYYFVDAASGEVLRTEPTALPYGGYGSEAGRAGAGAGGSEGAPLRAAAVIAMLLLVALVLWRWRR